jgi:hypothetical protein
MNLSIDLLDELGSFVQKIFSVRGEILPILARPSPLQKEDTIGFLFLEIGRNFMVLIKELL